MTQQVFVLKGEHIALNDLLKLLSLAHSGGAAKQMIVAGQVKVDGVVELRKTCKIRAGQVVWAVGEEIRVVAPGGE